MAASASANSCRPWSVRCSHHERSNLRRETLVASPAARVFTPAIHRGRLRARARTSVRGTVRVSVSVRARMRVSDVVRVA